jgi:hypothetical protein
MNHLRLMARREERRSERERGLRDLGKREGAPHLSRVARLARIALARVRIYMIPPVDRAKGFAGQKVFSRSQDAVIRVCDSASKMPNNSAQFSPCSLLPIFLLAGGLNPRKLIGQTHLSSQAPLFFPEEFRSKARSNS